ncbi:MAG: hypothetical protein M1832_003882 [Thelocarpon impressellum]|nr:MAG: hypothetical protein M1832_003882 [Thelocarpon impressellum]
MKGSLGYVVLLLTAVAAVPVELEPRAIPNDVFDKLVLYSQFSAAAYCVNNNDSPNNELTCPKGNCPLVEAADASSTLEFQNSRFTDTTGFVAVDKTNRQIVMAIRGSQSVQNFVADVVFVGVPWNLCADCKVHKGFWLSWLELRSDITKAVNAAIEANPGFSVVFTGHSLGGAVATIAAADIRRAGTQVALYTYGSPRIGNAKLAEFITAQAPGANFRVTHRDDPVPRLPPILFQYQHVSPEFHIKRGDDVVNPADIVTYEGGVNFGGNSGTIGLNIVAHTIYFGRIGACGPGIFEV